jgi:hypothetical protein
MVEPDFEDNGGMADPPPGIRPTVAQQNKVEGTSARRRLFWAILFVPLAGTSIAIYMTTGDPSLLNGVVGSLAVFTVLVALSWIQHRRHR